MDADTFYKYVAVGLGGYFIGFYSLKYRAMKAVLKECQEKEEEENSKKLDNEEGS